MKLNLRFWDVMALSVLAATALLAFAGCTSVPNKFDEALLSVRTNYVPQVSYATNLVQSNVVSTGYMGIVRDGEIYYDTNSPVYVTQYVTVPIITPATNIAEVYTYDVSTNTQSVIGAVTAAGTPFGFGWIGTLAGLAIATYAQFRNRQWQKVADSLVQSTEIARNVIQGTPNGAALDSRLVSELIKVQAQAGTQTLIASKVSNVDKTTTGLVAARLVSKP